MWDKTKNKKGSYTIATSASCPSRELLAWEKCKSMCKSFETIACDDHHSKAAAVNAITVTNSLIKIYS